MQDLKLPLEESFRIALKNTLKSAERNKTRFEQRIIPSALEVGDRVTVRNVHLRRKHKLADKWESDVFVVISRAGDIPVYKVQLENKDGPIHTLHRDLLLPCGFVPADENNELPCDKPPVPRPCTRLNLVPEIYTYSPVKEESDKASLTLNVPAVCFTVEKTCPVPAVSLTGQPEESSIPAPSSVSFVPLEEPDLEQIKCGRGPSQ